MGDSVTKTARGTNVVMPDAGAASVVRGTVPRGGAAAKRTAVSPQKSTFLMGTKVGPSQAADTQMTVDSLVALLARPVDLIKHPEKARAQKAAVKKLFQLKAEKSLTKALIRSIEEDRPDVFFAILSELNPTGTKKLRTMEPALLHAVATHLNGKAQRRLIKTRTSYILYLAARWVQSRFLFSDHPKQFEVTRACVLLLNQLHVNDPLFWQDNDVESSVHLMLKLFGSPLYREFYMRFRALASGVLRNRSSAGSFVEGARVIAALRATAPHDFPLKDVFARSVTRALKRSPDVRDKVFPSARHVVTAALHAHNRSTRKAFTSLLRHRLSKSQAIAILKEMFFRERKDADPRHVLKEIATISKAAAYDMLVDVVLRGRMSLVRELLSEYATLLQFMSGAKGEPSRKALDGVMAAAVRGPIKQRLRAIEVLGSMPSEDVGKMLARFSRSTERAISEAALRAYVRWVKRAPDMRWPRKRAIGPRGYYDVPSVKAPDKVIGVTTSIGVQKGMLPADTEAIDWNKDGKVRGFYERYRLWLATVKKYTFYRRVLTDARYETDPVLRRAALLMRHDLKKLLPLYAHLPQVNFEKQTVRVGAHVVKVESTRGNLSQKMLYAIGEAIASVPPRLQDILFGSDKGLGRLRFRVHRKALIIDLLLGGLRKGTYDGWMKSITGKRYASLRERLVQALGDPSVSDSVGMAMAIYWAVHEIGHAVDHQLAYEWTKNSSCMVRSAVPILSALHLRVPCKNVLPSFSLNYRSLYGDLNRLWVDARRKSGLGVPTMLAWRPPRGGGRSNTKLYDNFVSAYAATNPLEFFAENYFAYMVEKSPWNWGMLNVPTRAKLKEINPRYHRFFQRLEHRYSH